MLILFKALSTSKTVLDLNVSGRDAAFQGLLPEPSPFQLIVDDGSTACRVVLKDTSNKLIQANLMILTDHGWHALDSGCALIIPVIPFRLQVRATQKCRVTKPFRLEFVNGSRVIAASEELAILSAPPKGFGAPFARGEKSRKSKSALMPVQSAQTLRPAKYTRVHT